MKILFCNITYMNNYIGKTNDDMPTKGGAWVQKNNEAHEQWNFLNVDGFCYGFVMNKGEEFAIERIDGAVTKTSEVDDVTIVWCALNNSNKTVIVGWYEHATVYRNFHDSVVTPLFGLDRMYFCKADANDCYLLPENKRVFTIGRASKEGSGKGFGQQNYWYAESDYARNELIPEVIKFMENNRDERINKTKRDFEDSGNKNPLSDVEMAKADELFSNGDYLAFLPYGYRCFHSTKTADAAYDIASALCSLYQYEYAAKWYEKVIEIEGENWNNTSYFPYLYQQIGLYEKSVDSAMKLLKFEESRPEEVKHEIYGIIADNLYYQNKKNEAILWLDKIISESSDNELIRYTISVRKEWSGQ